jgi:hypothetical protein
MSIFVDINIRAVYDFIRFLGLHVTYFLRVTHSYLTFVYRVNHLTLSLKIASLLDTW